MARPVTAPGVSGRQREVNLGFIKLDRQLLLSLVCHTGLSEVMSHSIESTATTTPVNLSGIVFVPLPCILIFIFLLTLLSLLFFISMSANWGDSVDSNYLFSLDALLWVLIIFPSLGCLKTSETYCSAYY